MILLYLILWLLIIVRGGAVSFTGYIISVQQTKYAGTEGDLCV